MQVFMNILLKVIKIGRSPYFYHHYTKNRTVCPITYIIILCFPQQQNTPYITLKGLTMFMFSWAQKANTHLLCPSLFLEKHKMLDL